MTALINKIQRISENAKNPWFKEYWQGVAEHLKNNKE